MILANTMMAVQKPLLSEMMSKMFVLTAYNYRTLGTTVVLASTNENHLKDVANSWTNMVCESEDFSTLPKQIKLGPYEFTLKESAVAFYYIHNDLRIDCSCILNVIPVLMM